MADKPFHELREDDVIKEVYVPKKEKKSILKRLFLFLGKFTIKYTVFTVTIVYLSLVISDNYRSLKSEIDIRVESLKNNIAQDFGLVKYEARSPESEGAGSPVRLDFLVDQYSRKYQLSSAVVWAMIEKESTFRHDRVKFEPSWKESYGDKYPKQAWMNEEEYNLIFSSFGLLQISFAIWGDTCGLKSYSDLYDVDRNLDCGLKIVRGCLDRRKDQSDPLWQCFKEYNAGPKPKPKAALQGERYANDVMSRLGKYLVKDVNLDLKSLTSKS